MSMTLRFVLFALFLLAFVNAGTRPEDLKWLQAKASEEGVVATGTGLLYKGTYSKCCSLIHNSFEPSYVLFGCDEMIS